jgi:hypothetical protein
MCAASSSWIVKVINHDQGDLMNQAILPTRAATRPATQLRNTLLVAAVLGVALDAIYYYGGVGGVADETPLRATSVAACASAVTAAVLWWTNRAAFSDVAGPSTRRTVILTAMAVVSVGGFWIGVAAPCGAAAFLFGRKAAAAGRTRLGTVAMVIAAVAIGATVILSLLGGS